LFYLLERLFPEQPQQRFVRKGTRVDAIYWFFDALVTKRLVTAVTIVVLIALVALRIPRANLLGHQLQWLQALEALLVANFCGYWSHRLMHSIPFLWRIHQVHHSSEQLDWLAAGRVHPFEAIWSRLNLLLPLFLLGFSPNITGFFGPLIGIYPFFVHSNVRFGYGWVGYVLVSPAFHRWHHAADREALHKNYSGLIPLFDFVFKTAHFPHDGKPARYGLAAGQAPETFWGQMRWPLR
jgi:sterol desaturase/sphingolipid hydroxylase (fatty acid hydroxylase superfamily)